MRPGMESEHVVVMGAPTCVAATKGSPLRGVTRLCTMLISSSASALASSVYEAVGDGNRQTTGKIHHQR